MKMITLKISIVIILLFASTSRYWTAKQWTGRVICFMN